MNAVSAWQAGVTKGPDQIERLPNARSLREYLELILPKRFTTTDVVVAVKGLPGTHFSNGIAVIRALHAEGEIKIIGDVPKAGKTRRSKRRKKLYVWVERA